MTERDLPTYDVLSICPEGNEAEVKEMIMASNWIPEPILNPGKCNGCGTCVDLCHAHALEMANDKAAIVRPGDCDYCGDCEANCPQGAIGCPYEIVLD